MTENRDLFWCGTSGSLQKQAGLVPFNLNERLGSMFPVSNSIVYATGQQIDFAVVKINCTWSKTMSLTNFMIADLRAVNQAHPHIKI